MKLLLYPMWMCVLAFVLYGCVLREGEDAG